MSLRTRTSPLPQSGGRPCGRIPTEQGFAGRSTRIGTDFKIGRRKQLNCGNIAGCQAASALSQRTIPWRFP
jgi:hypothetical protein